MSLDDFAKSIKHVQNAGDDNAEAKVELYEQYIRYMAKGGVNAYHANKIARLIMTSLALDRKPFK